MEQDPEGDGVGGALGRHDRLVEADRRAQALGEQRVVAQVVGGERLFDEQKVERVELGEVIGVVERVGGVRVDLQHQLVTEALAHGSHTLHVETGLDLQLDAQVALVEVAGDLIEQLFDGVGDTDRHASRDAVAHGAEVLGERAPGGAQLGVEHGHLQRRLGHRVALEHGERRADSGGAQRRARCSSAGTKKCSITWAAPATYSDEYRGSSIATHSPQPTVAVPSTVPSRRTSSMSRWSCVPNEVRNGRRSGIPTRSSSTPSMITRRR